MIFHFYGIIEVRNQNIFEKVKFLIFKWYYSSLRQECHLMQLVLVFKIFSNFFTKWYLLLIVA